MKFCITVTLIAAICCTAVLCHAPDPETAQFIEACNKEHEVSAQEFNDFMVGKLKGAAVKDNLKCSLQCFMEKGGLMDESHKLKFDAAKQKMDNDPKMLEALNQCKDKAGPAPCETAYLISECMVEKKGGMH